MSGKKKLMVVTGGGDCPGLNAVIRGVARRAILHYGWEVVGSEDAFNGALETPRRIVPLTLENTRDLHQKGGTILGTTNKGDPFSYPVKKDGKVELVDRSGDLVRICKEEKVDCVVSIGGDGSARISQKLIERGLPCVCVPKTIDNDLSGTDFTFGFASAVQIATDAVDRLHTTGESHDRIMVLEVMGRDAGWIALAAGIAGGAHQILIPEVPFDLAKVAASIKNTITTEHYRNPYAIVVVAEGAKPKGGSVVSVKVDDPAYKMMKLGGIGLQVADELQKLTGIDARYTVLGHIQRGGSPIAFDRILATEYGVHAVDMIAAGKIGYMASYRTPNMVSVPIKEAIATYKHVESAGSLMQTARGLGIGFGD